MGGGVPTDAVDQRSRQCGGEHEASEEDPAVHGRCYPDVSHTACPGLEHFRFVLGLAEYLDQEGSGDVETFAHHGVHFRVEVVSLPRDGRKAAPNPACRENEHRQHAKS